MAQRTGITDREVQATKPGEWLWEAIGDGCSLGLRVTPNGVKTFVFRYRFDRQAKRMKVGRYGDRPGEMSLKEARSKALALAAVVATGSHYDHFGGVAH